MVKAMKLQLFYHMTKIDCASSHHEQFNQIINRSNIIITGNNNHVSMHFDSEEKSNVSIGEDSQLSWGIGIWCTDAHTITNLKGKPINLLKV